MKTALLTTSIVLLFAGIVLPTALGWMWPAYSMASNYLSELGAVGAPHADIMNYAGFLPVGVLWLFAVFFLYRLSPKGGSLLAGSLLLLGTSVAYAGVAVFPCDAGCPAQGSPSQLMHNLVGALGYLTAIPALFMLGAHYNKNGARSLSALTFLTAVLFTIGFAAIASSETVAYKGAWQRLADFSLFLWMFAAAVLLKGAKAE